MKKATFTALGMAAALLASTSFAQTAPMAPPAKSHHDRMKSSDSNGDGTITKDEYMSGAEKRFDTMDADHDGQIGQAEREAMRQKFSAKRAAKQQAAPQGDINQ